MTISYKRAPIFGRDDAPANEALADRGEGGMGGDELEAMLRAWGREYGEHSCVEIDERRRAPAVHPIAVAMEFAPGKRVRRLDVALRRMIRKGERSWSRDPIVCNETRANSGIGSSVRMASGADRVQALVLQLGRTDKARALVLTAQYCRHGAQHEKAEWVSAQGHRMSVRTYRERLASARGWIEAKITA